MEHIPFQFKEQKCLYCTKELDKESWDSHWGDKDIHHYKSIKCEHCTKKNWIRVNFQGSGHDFVAQGTQGSLESTIFPADGRGKF